MLAPRMNMKAYTVTRFAAGTIVNGNYTKGASSSVPIRANVLPFTSTTKVLPEGRHAEDTRVILTASELRVAAPGGDADIITIGGAAFEVFEVNGFPGHYEALAGKMQP